MGFRTLCCLVVLTSAALAQNTKMLTPVDELAANLKDKSLVVLHVGSAKDYEAGHIPGARLLSLADISVTGEGGLRLQLPPLADLKTALEKLGITNSSRVVIYPANESVQSATRVWFTFDYLGLGGKASLLDGGLAAWKASGRAVSTDPVIYETGSVQVTAHPEKVVSLEWVRDHLKDANVRIVDSRTPEFYTGASPGAMPRAGRIPGAKNVPFPTLLDEQRKMLPATELKTRLGADRPILVSYCHIGQQATVIYFVARMLGLDVRLYDGSFQEWSQRTEVPVETGQ